MRIAFISLMGGTEWGGSEALWHKTAVHALHQGDEVFVSIYDWGKKHEKIKELEQAGGVISLRKKFNPCAGILERLNRFIKNRVPSLNEDYQNIIDFKPDHIFISQGDSFDLSVHHFSLYGLIKKYKIAYSFVCHSHSQYSFIPDSSVYPRAIDIFNGADKVYFVSNRQWKLTERRLASNLLNGRFTWNPLNMLIPEQCFPWPDNDTIQFAIVGSLECNKGQDTAMEVLSRSIWTQRQWKLNLYGKGNGQNYLSHLADFYSISENVIFHGHVSDISDVWKKNHVLLIPSSAEGLPISLIEAMVSGRPSIVTDVGGNSELIIDDETGFVASSPTVDSFAEAMERGWQNKHDWSKIGEVAFEKIKSMLDIKPEITIYKSIVNVQ